LPQGYQVAPFERIAAHLRTILAAHVPLKLVDRCRLGPTDHIERHRLVPVAPKAANFEVHLTSVQRVTQCWRWLRWFPEAEHAFVPCVARQPISLLAGLLGTLAANVLPIIREAQKAGANTLRQIADALNARGIPTARGGQWHATSVKNLLERA
jgi:hypothetical protein